MDGERWGNVQLTNEPTTLFQIFCEFILRLKDKLFVTCKVTLTSFYSLTNRDPYAAGG